MKKFAFRLETLLRHRSHLEEKERNKFALVRAKLLAEINHKDALQIRQGNALAELKLKQSEPYDAEETGWYYRFLNRLEEEIQRSNKRALQLEKDLEMQKQVMIRASRDKQMIENIRKKKQKEYRVALDREDQKSNDEIVVTRFAHKP